jgi:3-methyladenine DNA glycosylase AlkD
MTLKVLRTELNTLSDPSIAAISKRFFKTGSGQYGEGDIFIGVRVPVLRKLAKQYRSISITSALELLRAPVHEERLLGLFLLIHHYRSGDPDCREVIYNHYLKHSEYINNWDLVDASAEHIVGHFLIEKDKGPLFLLAQSDALWERRIAILATFCYIKRGRFDETLLISDILLNDGHDLIQKAVGWMLREVGKRDQAAEETFLLPRYRNMPRTMLRYAIEKFPEPIRKSYLRSSV